MKIKLVVNHCLRTLRKRAPGSFAGHHMEKPTQELEGFKFEPVGDAHAAASGRAGDPRAVCDVNWARVARTNTHRIERTADFRALRPFIADVALGDAERGGDTRAQKAEKALADFQRLSRDAASRARAQHDLELQAQARELDAAYASRSAQAASDTVHVDPESGAAFTAERRRRRYDVRWWLPGIHSRMDAWNNPLWIDL